jgi:hypothetical protein
MGLLFIYSLGEKIADKCGGATSGNFIDFLRSDCFIFIAAVVIAAVVEAIGLDFLFTGPGPAGSGTRASAPNTPPSFREHAESQQTKPASTLSEIWGPGGGPDSISLQDVVAGDPSPSPAPPAGNITLQDVVDAAAPWAADPPQPETQWPQPDGKVVDIIDIVE